MTEIVPLNRNLIWQDSFDPVVFKRWPKNNNTGRIHEPEHELNLLSTLADIYNVSTTVEADPSLSSQENISVILLKHVLWLFFKNIYLKLIMRNKNYMYVRILL